LVISDDAHSIDEIGSYFEKAEEELLKLSCHKRLDF